MRGNGQKEFPEEYDLLLISAFSCQDHEQQHVLQGFAKIEKEVMFT